jgi:signal transduction histidine kinase
MSAFAISSLLTAIASFVLGIFVIYKQKILLNKLWFLVSLSVAIWSFGLYGVVVSQTEGVAFFWQHVLDFGGLLIPFFFFNFVLIILDLHRERNKELLFSYTLACILIILSFTSLFKIGMRPVFDFQFWVEPGKLYNVFPLVFIIYAIYSIFLILSRYKNLTPEKQSQVKYILFVALIGFGGGATNFLPQISKVYPFGNYLVILYIFVISYAITKHKLFDIKIVATGLFGFALVAFSFAEIILAKGLSEVIFRSIIFFLTSFFVFLLVKSVIKDIKQKEQLEKLAEDLKQSNEELEEHNLYLTSLQKISNLITRSLDFEKVTQSIVDAIAKEMGYIGGILSFIDETKKGIYIGAISNTPTTTKVVGLLPQDPKNYLVALTDKENISIKAIQTKEIQYSDNFYDSIRPALTKEIAQQVQEMAGIKGVMFVPVYAEDEIVGVLDYVLSKPISDVSNEEKEMMKSLADQVGIVSRNLQLFRKLEKTNTELRDANFYLQKLDKAKSEFLSIASHQLRTPLTGIKGHLSMILEGDFGKVAPELSKIIQEVYESSNRLTRLVNVFLNVSRIESGRFQVDKIKFSLTDLVEQVVKELNSGAIRKNLILTLKKTKVKMPDVFADKDKIKDVLLNLVDNSIKYTPAGKIDVTVEKLEDNKLKVMISDTGVGIDPEEATKLFAKFSRGDGIAQVDTTGSGLGLYIAKKIVEAHGGKIWAESDGKGKGSRFIFELPIE